MKKEEIEGRLTNVVKRFTGDEDKSFKSNSTFSDLGINSFALFQLIIAVEEEFGIEIPNHDVAKIRTFKDSVRYLKKRLK